MTKESGGKPPYSKDYWAGGFAAGLVVDVAGLAAGFVVVAGLAGAVAAAPTKVADLIMSRRGHLASIYFLPPLVMASWSIPAVSKLWP